MADPSGIGTGTAGVDILGIAGVGANAVAPATRACDGVHAQLHVVGNMFTLQVEQMGVIEG